MRIRSVWRRRSIVRITGLPLLVVLTTRVTAELVVEAGGHMMGCARCVAVVTIPAVAIVATAVGCAGAPAKHSTRPTTSSPSSTSTSPATQMDGRYWAVTYYSDGSHPNTWVFTSCGDGCADLDIAQGGSSDHAVARYVNNQWTVEVRSRGAIQCGDGTTGPGVAHYTWNPDTLKGRYWSTSDAHVCGNPDPVETDPVPLTLTKIH